MLNFLARHWAKLRYRFNEQVKAETLLINARSSERTVERVKVFIQQLQAKAEAADAQAIGMEDNIKAVDEKMSMGFWQCESGHEVQLIKNNVPESTDSCPECKKSLKMVRTDLLTGQEKYENEKERRDVERMAEASHQEASQIREEIKRQEADIENHLAIAKSFNDQAKRTQNFAELLREL